MNKREENVMAETVSFLGKPLQLKGNLVKEGSPLPDCELTNAELKPVKLSKFKGKVLLILTVPSLDTSVCSKETHRFNEEIKRFHDALSAVVISMDLPFAQKRWCEAENAKNVILLSDFKMREAGEKLGVFIPDIGLLARAVFVCDHNFVVKHVQLVKEITEEPDYTSVIKHVEQLCSNVK